MKQIRGILWAIIGIFLINTGITNAQEFHIMEEVNPERIPELNIVVDAIGATWGKVMQTYREKANELSLSEQMATGIMNRTTILDYIVYLVKFLSQIGLLIGAVMIIYAGYIYATNIFGGKESNANSAIKYALIGVIVITFSYAIIRFFTALFLGT